MALVTSAPRHLRVRGLSATLAAVGSLGVVVSGLLANAAFRAAVAVPVPPWYGYFVAIWGGLHIVVAGSLVAFVPAEEGWDVLVGDLARQSAPAAVAFALLEAAAFVARAAGLPARAAALAWLDRPEVVLGLAASAYFFVVLGAAALTWSAGRGSRAPRVVAVLGFAFAGLLALAPVLMMVLP